MKTTKSIQPEQVEALQREFVDQTSFGKAAMQAGFHLGLDRALTEYLIFTILDGRRSELPEKEVAKIIAANLEKVEYDPDDYRALNAIRKRVKNQLGLEEK